MTEENHPFRSGLTSLLRKLRQARFRLFAPGGKFTGLRSGGFVHRLSKPSGSDTRRAQGISILLHLLALALLMSVPPGRVELPRPAARGKEPPVFFARKIPPHREIGEKSSGGGAGGQREPDPPTRGIVPPFASIQFVPPTPRIKNTNPALHAQPTLLGPEGLALPNPALMNFGNPMELLVNLSSGPGSLAGIGRGVNGTGIGDEGSGGGYLKGERWGTGGGQPGRGRLLLRSAASCQYCPNPKYSEEARKSKYSGVVLLAVVVTPEGKATNIRVLQGVGMGLDEQAIEAVKKWQFNPAIGLDGRPVASEVTIQVDFRLL